MSKLSLLSEAPQHLVLSNEHGSIYRSATKESRIDRASFPVLMVISGKGARWVRVQDFEAESCRFLPAWAESTPSSMFF